jgi:hypothetical protein
VIALRFIMRMSQFRHIARPARPIASPLHMSARLAAFAGHYPYKSRTDKKKHLAD